MNFTTAIRTCLSKYATFSGRATRSEFWWFYLFIILIDLATAAIDSALDLDGVILDVDGFVSGLVHLALFLPSLAAGTRRLHDIGRSGWSQLLIVIPILGWIVLVYWWTRPTQPVPNAYGDVPRHLTF